MIIGANNPYVVANMDPWGKVGRVVFVCFDSLRYEIKTIFQSCWDRSSWVLNCEPILSRG